MTEEGDIEADREVPEEGLEATKEGGLLTKEEGEVIAANLVKALVGEGIHLAQRVFKYIFKKFY